MAGTLITSTLQGTTLTDGTNSTSTTNCIKGSAKAWVSFNGTGTPAIRTSYNVSSITDNGTGDYTVNFTTAMADANYSAVATIQESGSFFSSVATITNSSTASPTTSAVRFTTFGWTSGTAGSNFDPPIVNVSIFD
jgi:hypothetical protein